MVPNAVFESPNISKNHQIDPQFCGLISSDQGSLDGAGGPNSTRTRGVGLEFCCKSVLFDDWRD